MNVGIVGASGYSGEVLVKFLLGHPQVKLTAVTSRQHAGKPVSAVIPALRGTAADQLKFIDSDAQALAARDDIALWFLALPHGAAADFAKALLPAGRKVVDLSADFRVADLATYEKYYGRHHAPELLPAAKFVLPELTDPKWKSELKLAAAPGCYPTSTLVPLAPLLKAGLVSREHIVVNSFSGVSGAGKKVEEQYLYVERSESAKAYGLTKHRHLAEIEEQLSAATGAKIVLQFNPHLAPMRRGIATTITVPAAKGATIEAVYAAWQTAYAGRPFVAILPAGETPDTAHTLGTNRVDISAVHDARTGNFVITSALDNLVKGASGQAVQIMNLWLGLPEAAGLA
ncbi:N-acetyl-gamma-glutamyl-phosphate reductase [Opitutus sp. GAS368]|jgi:N-acetyl-gamma-glutamyl-phosphate reductase|uniref:N-acetyl-gamma-glutamyl-phosphate reductase n=1 Tax=Opitutus sp. GAS368 TaxID=1882749 RepID=UPI00087B992A|nr:N-acetyl-gamma-glutamyl-phosphate reductase [Opitutus sp. GAS368]SDR88089.1 N-acetyl-gamma-glutamyl-phosphate reductase [Opitutus sp. GAS368]